MTAISIRELIAWGLDENPYRAVAWPREALWAKVDEARAAVESREPYNSGFAELATPEGLRPLLDQQANRPDLHHEMQGLTWRLGLIDLAQLIAFQRRITPDQQPVPQPRDWAALIHLTFAPPRPIVFTITSNSTRPTIHTENPDLSIRLESTGIHLHGGSPFFEVARYRERYFLRDGYHRAYRLLRAGVPHVPAVIVEAASLTELGAIGDRFFDEANLLSARPPRLADFADHKLIIEYTRPPLRKSIHLHIEETFEPINESQGEQS